MARFIDDTPIGLFLVLALTLGLAPFLPEPHLWEKLKMLASGELRQPVDVFDMLMHGAPWVLLVIKLIRMGRRRG